MGKNFSFVAAVGIMASGAFAGVIHVPADYPTIQGAIDHAQHFDTIVVAMGEHSGGINFAGKILSIQSTNPADQSTVLATIIAGNAGVPVVLFTGLEDQGVTALDGLTLTGGISGIIANGAVANVRRCVIENNNGVGIQGLHGEIDDCTIHKNGGGISNCNGVIRGCYIGSNMGLGVVSCDGFILDSVIDKNEGDGVRNGYCDIVRSTISGNEGAGLARHYGRVSQSSIVNNWDGVAGHHGYVGPDSGSIDNCIIAGNLLHGISYSHKDVLNCTITGNRGIGLLNHVGTISNCNRPANRMAGSVW